MKTKTIHFIRPHHITSLLTAALAVGATTVWANDEQARTQKSSDGGEITAAEARQGGTEVLGLPTSNNDGTILGVFPAPSAKVEAGSTQSYIAEELADGDIDPGVDNVFEADQDAVGAPPISEREKAAGKFIPPGQSQKQQQQRQDSSIAQASKSPSGSKVQFNELPSPVQKSFRAHTGTVNLENIMKVSKDGQTCYRANFDKDGLQGQLTVGQDGALIRSQRAIDFALIQAVPSVEQGTIQMDSLPDEVRNTIEQAAGSAKEVGLSKSSESGKTVYRAEFNDAGVHTELMVNESGKLLARIDQSALFLAPLEGSQKVSLQSAPDPVQETVRQYSGGSQAIADLDKGTWNGQTAYKVMIEKDGLPRHLVISENGQLLGDQESAAGSPASSETSRQEKSSQGQKQSQ